MELAILVYVIGIIESIRLLLVLVPSLGLPIAVGFGVTSDLGNLDARMWKWTKTIVALSITSIVLLVFVPSERTAYTMVAAYAAQKVSENDKVQQLSGKVLKLVDQKLGEYINKGVR